MAITSRVLTTGTAANVLYSTAASSKAVTAVYLCNKTGGTVAANVYVVPAGSSDIGNCIIYSNVSIAGFDSYIADTERLILESGDAVYANCSTANGLVMTISSVGI
jgi:hypothetical protein